jgi:hypothetical protein
MRSIGWVACIKEAQLHHTNFLFLLNGALHMHRLSPIDIVESLRSSYFKGNI